MFGLFVSAEPFVDDQMHHFVIILFQYKFQYNFSYKFQYKFKKMVFYSITDSSGLVNHATSFQLFKITFRFLKLVTKNCSERK